MRGKRTVADKFQKAGQHLFNGRRIRHHIVRNAGQFRDIRRDWFAGIDKFRKTLDNLSAAQLHGADLDNGFRGGLEPRGFNVENDDVLVQPTFLQAVHGAAGVIDVIGLQTVDDFDAVFFGSAQRLRESLCHTVIRDGNGGMAPFCRLRN